MKSYVKIISIDLILPGMELAVAVFNDAGDMLMTAGSFLTEKSILQLQKSKIKSVSILAKDRRGGEEVSLLRVQLDHQMDAMFSHAESDGHLAELRKLIHEYRLRKLT